jgi:hypothetical protein
MAVEDSPFRSAWMEIDFNRISGDPTSAFSTPSAMLPGARGFRLQPEVQRQPQPSG